MELGRGRRASGWRRLGLVLLGLGVLLLAAAAVGVDVEMDAHGGK